jgi:hypothetical protein
MAQFGRFFRGAVRRSRWYGKALVAGAKTAIDAVLNRDRAPISFEHLGDGPEWHEVKAHLGFIFRPVSVWCGMHFFARLGK